MSVYMYICVRVCLQANVTKYLKLAYESFDEGLNEYGTGGGSKVTSKYIYTYIFTQTYIQTYKYSSYNYEHITELSIY